MYSPFQSAFTETGRVPSAENAELLGKIEPYANGFSSFMNRFGGVSFDNAVYRIHTIQDILVWTDNVERALPNYKGRIICFAFDWLGRHLALDKGKIENDQMNVLLLEPGTGEALNIPASFSDFHNVELVEYRNDVLASSFHADWIGSGCAPPKHNQCAGYKVSLFLNGSQ